MTKTPRPNPSEKARNTQKLSIIITFRATYPEYKSLVLKAGKGKVSQFIRKKLGFA